MPRRRPTKAPLDELAPIPGDVLDQLAPNRPMTAPEVEAITRRLKKALLERALGAELTHHLGYPAGTPKPDAVAPNHRNGTSPKTVLTDDGPVALDSARPRRHVRAAADWETRAAVHGL